MLLYLSLSLSLSLSPSLYLSLSLSISFPPPSLSLPPSSCTIHINGHVNFIQSVVTDIHTPPSDNQTGWQWELIPEI